MNLLVVDDHPGMRDRITCIIRDAFPKSIIACASNGAEVFSLCSSSSYDAVIMDVRMPGSSGFEVLRKLREIYSFPVILTSTYPRNQYSLMALKAGANAFVPKEALADELSCTLRELLAIEAAARQ